MIYNSRVQTTIDNPIGFFIGLFGDENNFIEAKNSFLPDPKNPPQWATNINWYYIQSP